MSPLRALCLPAALVGTAYGYGYYKDDFPNGGNVQRLGDSWPGLGHENRLGSGPKNAFGSQVQGTDRLWTASLCRADTDDDGRSNGEELGDPDCVWSKGDTPARTTDISHPGYRDSFPASNPILPSAAPLVTSAFVKYEGYNGPLEVAGAVSIGEVDKTVQVIEASLTGVDPLCTGAQDGTGNNCGIHIHEGCTGGHYWNKIQLGADASNDPWVPITYTGVTDGAARVVGKVVNTALSVDDLQGMAFVVHDSNGNRVACAILSRATGSSDLAVSGFVKYPDYSGSLTVTGTVMEIIHVGTDQQSLRFSLTGADPACTPSVVISEANGCGLHFHSGTSCSDAASVGGHYWSTDVLGDNDPWRDITYRNAATEGVTIPVRTGFPAQSVQGRVVVVHDLNGNRIACGVITGPFSPTPAPPPAPTPAPTPAPAPLPTPAPPPTSEPTPAPTDPPQGGNNTGVIVAAVVVVILAVVGVVCYLRNQGGGVAEDGAELVEQQS